MKKTALILSCFSIFFLLSCNNGQQNPVKSVQSQTTSEVDSEAKISTPSEQTTSQFGECPDIYFESTKTLSNGAVVTWTSSFGGFDYQKGSNYMVTVTWSVTGGTATFVGFTGKQKTWTPAKDVNGNWSITNPTGGSLELTVKMSDMHRVVEPNWKGYTGNGHFKLELSVDGIKVKLGVNIHLEDPEPGFSDRCRGEEPPPPGGGGSCPDIFFESTKLLKNGALVTWTSSFGGFDYSKGTNYTVTVAWSASEGTATFVDFSGKDMLWTPPKDVTGRWSTTNPTNGSLELTVNMSDMHRVVEPDWQGYIGNGHFKLELVVDGITVRLSINIHLEDPDTGFSDRCVQ